jgi:ParB family chromosome partitioning protein
MKSNKLVDKAARLDFSNLPKTVPAAEDGNATSLSNFAPRPKTAPGALMAFANDTRSELLKENETLRIRAQDSEVLRSRLDDALSDLQHWDGAKAARLLDPNLVQPSRYANRHPASFEGSDYLKLKTEIQDAGGNVQPIKVRPIRRAKNELSERYEVVFGHRRLKACQELGLPVLSLIDNLDDQALFVEMERENRARKDLSAWEQGTMYRRALDMGLFPSNRKLSEAIGVDLSALGKALALANLPEFVVQAFPSPLTLQFRWAKPLSDAIAADPDRIRAEAEALSSQTEKLSAREVFSRLTAVQSARQEVGVEPFHPPVRELITFGGRDVASVVVQQDGRVDVSIEAGAMPVSAEVLQSLKNAIVAILRTSATS